MGEALACHFTVTAHTSYRTSITVVYLVCLLQTVPKGTDHWDWEGLVCVCPPSVLLEASLLCAGSRG